MYKNENAFSRILIFLILCLSIFGCNKIQTTDFEMIQQQGNPDSTDNNNPTSEDKNPPPDAPPDLPEVEMNCKNLPIQQQTSDFLFAKPNITCEWEKNGNLAPKNDYFQARIEDTKNLNLPEGAIICDIKFNFAVQKFLYDDHFLLTFNKAVIASSYDFGGRLNKSSGLLTYNWDQIAGMYWDPKKEGVFCPTGASCSWPDTDIAGQINMQFQPEMFRLLMAQDITRHVHEISFISIGDNDKYDCEHSDVNFSLLIDYVVP